MRLPFAWLGLIHLVAATAHGQTAAPVRATVSPTRLSPARAAIARAQTAYVAHDLDGAMTAYRAAVDANGPEQSEARLGVGYVLAARDDVDGALAAFRQAAAQAATTGDEMLRARALQSIATLFESHHRWADAATAWQDFVAFASSHSAVADAAVGRARLAILQSRAELEQRYAAVRQRIEQRRQSNGAQAPAPPRP